MTDQELFEEFESTMLDAAQFDHRTHIRCGWIYLTKFGLLEGMSRFSSALKAFAKAKGAPNRYHETITLAFLLIINERIARENNAEDFERFASANPDLFDWKNSVLRTYYREETLKSMFARKNFVFPDRVGEFRDEG